MSRPVPSPLSVLRSELPRGLKLLVAVSGGVDSIVLLHALLQLRRELAIEVGAAHVDHGLRPSSSHDAKFVADQLGSWQIPLFATNLPPLPRGANSEGWAREQRYCFLSEVRKQNGFDLILTAHHAGDVAETLLMRLVSNKELRTIAHVDQERKLFRPFLQLSRAQILEYAKANQLRWVEDPTNSDTTFLRNRVRHLLLPLLQQQFDPRIEETLCERALALADDFGALDHMARELVRSLEAHMLFSKDWLRELQRLVMPLPVGLQWRVVSHLLSGTLGYELGRFHASSVVAFILGEAVQIELPSGVTLRRAEGGLRLLR